MAKRTIIIPDYFAIEHKTYKGIAGTVYILCNKLTDDKKKSYKRLKYATISEVRHKYAPELTHDIIWVADNAPYEIKIN